MKTGKRLFWLEYKAFHSVARKAHLCTLLTFACLFSTLPANIFAQEAPADPYTQALDHLCTGRYQYRPSMEIDKAIAEFQAAQQLLLPLGPSIALAEVYSNLGATEAAGGELASGLQHLRQADSILKIVCPEGCAATAINQFELGTFFFFRKRNVRQARDHLEAALDLFMSTPHLDTFQMSTAILYLGHTSRELGENSRAIELYGQGMELRRRHYAPGSRELMIMQVAIGTTQYMAGNYAAGKTTFEEALAWQALAPQSSLSEASALHNNLALCLVELGEYDAAVHEYELVRNLLRDRALPTDRELRARNLLNTAIVYQRMDQPHQARAFFALAQAELRPIEHGTSLAAQVQQDLSYFYSQRAQYDSALVHIHKAIHLLVAGVPQDSLFELPTAQEVEGMFELKEHLAMKGELILQGVKAGHWTPDHLPHALACFDLAITAIDALWLEVDDPGDKLSVNQAGVSIYEQAMQAAATLWLTTKDPAYLARVHEYMERSKAQLMLETIRRARAAYLAGIPETLLTQYELLRSDIADLSARLRVHGALPDSAAILHDRLLKARFASDAFSRQLAQEYPQYAQLIGQRAPAPIQQLQERFQDPAKLFIEYYLSDSTLYTISIYRGQPTLRITPLTPDFKADLNLFLATVASPRSSLKQLLPFQQAAHDLYITLLGPEIQAAGPDLTRIRIVPDAQLAAFPFDALVVQPAPNPKQFAHLDYAIQHYQISFAPSSTLLLEESALLHQSNPLECLGLAWAEASNPEAQSRFPQGGQRFPNIPGTAEEINRLQATIEGQYFKGKLAHEANFKRHAPQYGVIHLALHGRAGEEEPFLAFPEPGPGEDGILYLEELYNLPLRARLTVLSACETGVGLVQEGEGVMSMARGFGIAGCPTTVMSLWEVDDRASSLIMDGFYAGLADGIEIDAALRQAKLDYLSRTTDKGASPFYWAAFIPVGANDPVSLKLIPSPWPFYVAIGATFALSLAFVAYIRYRRKKV